MSRLLKEVQFGSSVLFTFAGQTIVIKVRRSDRSEHVVRLTIEADTEVQISNASGAVKP